MFARATDVVNQRESFSDNQFIGSDRSALTNIRDQIQPRKDMTLKSTPYLLFDGNCAEAMTYYHGCIGGERTLTKLEDTPMKDQFPVEKHRRVINAHLINDDLEFSGSDWMASPEFDPVQGNTTAIFVEGLRSDDVRSVFNSLAVGSDTERFQDLHESPIGTYGQFYDRYGVQWIFLIR